MRATLTREGHDVGVFSMTRDGDYEWDCFDEERERFEAAIKQIIEELREPDAFVGRGGGPGAVAYSAVTYEPGHPGWFDRVLARLQNKGTSTSSSTMGVSNRLLASVARS